jgi:transposase
LHAVTDAQRRPIRLHITAGQISDHTGAAALIETLSKVDWLLADRGYDADWFKRLKDKEITPCILGRKSRKKAIKYDKRRYKRRNRIEIMFGRLKDWRRIATRYDRCPVVFRPAIELAVAAIFWLSKEWVLSLTNDKRHNSQKNLTFC